MHISIDYTSALAQGAGIGRYTRELVSALSEIDHENRYLLVCPRNSRGKQVGNWPPNFKPHILPISQWLATVLWHRLRAPLPLDLFTGPVDIFHSPDFVLPPLRHGKTILTVHDLSFLRYPECFEPSLVKYLRRLVPRSVGHASLVLADSESTKRDLVELMKVPAQKIEVLYAGVNSTFIPISDERFLAAVLKKYFIEAPFLLFVGTIEPRKNLERLLQSYSRLHVEEGIQQHLLLAGELGWLYADLFQEVQRLKLENSVRFLGYVPDDELPVLMSLADLFVFPSLYEGFGLPPLEAMACGTPVVASNTSSLIEILGDAALLVDPARVDLLAEAIYQALTNTGQRQSMVAKGLDRAKKFTWSRAARTLLLLYEQVAEV